MVRVGAGLRARPPERSMRQHAVIVENAVATMLNHSTDRNPCNEVLACLLRGGCSVAGPLHQDQRVSEARESIGIDKCGAC